MKVEDIKVKQRFRKDFGDLEPLKQSIAEIGVLHPIVVNKDNTLVAGERRLRAIKELGWKEAPVTRVDIDQIIKGEFDENQVRKDFTISESVAIWQAMEKYSGGSGGSSKLTDSDSLYRRDRAAKFLGISHDSLSKAKQVLESKNEELIQKMDQSGKVNNVYRELKIEEKKKEVEKLEPEKELKGLFDVIVIDPPWDYGIDYDSEAHRGTAPYPTMSIEQLKGLKLPSNEDCVLWLWVTNSFLKDSFELLESWGFEPKTILTWDKQIMGVGHWLRNITEHCILAVKGKPVWDNKKYTTLISEKRREHSRKPEAFYKMVEQICHGRKLDYFGRYVREGWQIYGNKKELVMENKE